MDSPPPSPGTMSQSTVPSSTAAALNGLPPPQKIQSLFKLVQELSQCDPALATQSILDENVNLKEENATLETTNEVNIKTITKLQGQVDEHAKVIEQRDADLATIGKEKDKISKRIGEVEGELKYSKKELEVSKRVVKTLQASLKTSEAEFDSSRKELAQEKKRAETARELEIKTRTELETAKELLESTKDRLGRLEGYALKLASVEKEMSAVIKRLGAIYGSACGLADRHMGHDLPDALLSDPTALKEVRNKATELHITLPSSNSAAAKRMRVAVFLAALGNLLTKHIFQPVYLPGGNDLCGLIDKLSDEKPEQSAHLRAVLLQSFPLAREETGEERIRIVVDEMMKCFGPLLRNDGTAAAAAAAEGTFKAALEETCKQAWRTWCPLQAAREQVKTDIEMSHWQEWKTWLSTPASKTSGARQARRDNKARLHAQQSGSPSSENRNENGNGTASEDSDEPPVVEVPIWPVFYFYSGNSEYPHILAQGLGLGEEEVREARAEEQQQGARRAARQAGRRERRGTMSSGAGGPGVVVNGSPTKTFLSTGGGGSGGSAQNGGS